MIERDRRNRAFVVELARIRSFDVQAPAVAPEEGELDHGAHPVTHWERRDGGQKLARVTMPFVEDRDPA